MTEQTKQEAAKEAALSDLAKLTQKVGRAIFSGSSEMEEGVKIIPKTEVGAVKKKRKYTRRAKRGRGRPKGSGKRRGPGRPKGKPGRPKGKGKRGRPKASGKVSKGLIAGAVRRQVKPLLKAQSKALKEQIKAIVTKEVKKALKAALR